MHPGISIALALCAIFIIWRWLKSHFQKDIRALKRIHTLFDDVWQGRADEFALEHFAEACALMEKHKFTWEMAGKGTEEQWLITCKSAFEAHIDDIKDEITSLRSCRDRHSADTDRGKDFAKRMLECEEEIIFKRGMLEKFILENQRSRITTFASSVPRRRRSRLKKLHPKHET